MFSTKEMFGFLSDPAEMLRTAIRHGHRRAVSYIIDKFPELLDDKIGDENLYAHVKKNGKRHASQIMDIILDAHRKHHRRTVKTFDGARMLAFRSVGGRGPVSVNGKSGFVFVSCAETEIFSAVSECE